MPIQEIKAPGWGGAWAGSGVKCEVANDLNHVPDACKMVNDKPGERY